MNAEEKATIRRALLAQAAESLERAGDAFRGLAEGTSESLAPAAAHVWAVVEDLDALCALYETRTR